MPRPRPKIYSAWEYLGIDVMKVLNKSPHNSRSGPIHMASIMAVIVVAISPGALPESLKIPEAGELAKVFAEFYSERPNLTIELMTVIRKKWNDGSIAAKTRRQCLTKIWLTRPHYETPGIPTCKATDEEVRYKIDPRLKKEATQAVKQARFLMQIQSQRPGITRELWAALRVLRDRGFDVGDGM